MVLSSKSYTAKVKRVASTPNTLRPQCVVHKPVKRAASALKPLHLLCVQKVNMRQACSDDLLCAYVCRSGNERKTLITNPTYSILNIYIYVYPRTEEAYVGLVYVSVFRFSMKKTFNLHPLHCMTSTYNIKNKSHVRYVGTIPSDLLRTAVPYKIV